MKDLQTVLRAKEQDVERVRKEIQALLTVIPLLAEEQASPDDVMHQFHMAVTRTSLNPADNGMAELEPFARQLRNSSAHRA
jgi:hypothetical protein